MNQRQLAEMRKTVTGADVAMLKHCCREISEDAFHTVSGVPNSLLADVLASALTFALARTNRWAYRVPKMVQLRLDRGWSLDQAARKMIGHGAKTMDASGLHVIERKPPKRDGLAQPIVHALEKVYAESYEALVEPISQETVPAWDGCID